MVTEYTYQIARVHFELVREWNQKRRNYLADFVFSVFSPIFKEKRKNLRTFEKDVFIYSQPLSG